MGETKLKHQRYATQKDLKELTAAVSELSKKVLEFVEWETYDKVKQHPEAYDTETRKEIIEKSTGLLKFLYKNLFANNPQSLALEAIKNFPSDEDLDCVEWSIKIHEWQEKYPALFPSSVGVKPNQ